LNETLCNRCSYRTFLTFSIMVAQLSSKVCYGTNLQRTASPSQFAKLLIVRIFAFSCAHSWLSSCCPSRQPVYPTLLFALRISFSRSYCLQLAPHCRGLLQNSVFRVCSASSSSGDFPFRILPSSTNGDNRCCFERDHEIFSIRNIVFRS